MIIMLIRYIFLLLLINNFIYAGGVNVTFELFHAENKYLDIALEKGAELQSYGFKCYILKGKKELSVRCDDSNTTTKMQRIINKFKKKKIEFTIINKDTKTKRVKYKTLNEFYLGYAAFDRKDYKRAFKIFKYNYEKEKSYKHAYAYALILMKFKKYDESLNVLKKYKRIQKARKLYDDISSTYMYQELKKKHYAKAHLIVAQYKHKDKRLHRIIYIREINDAIDAKEYDKATALSKKYNLLNKLFDIDYMRALNLVKLKNYKDANKILAPYRSKERRADSLYISNIIAIATKPYAKKNYKEALDILEKDRASSKKVQNFYDDILYNRALDIGWIFVDKKPASALVSFKEACRIKEKYACYSGMMYSYYNLGLYDKSHYLATKLFHFKRDDELSLMAMRSDLKMKNYDDAKKWFDLIKNKKGLSNPYLLETLLSIDDKIKVKKYEDAQNIIDYMRGLYPTNIEILKRQMQLYILEKRYDDAQDTASNILFLDKTSIDAKYTLALYEFEHNDYKTCVSRLENLTLMQTYQIQLFKRCEAYASVENRDINTSIKYIQEINDDGIKSAFYLDLADLYKSADDNKSLLYYDKARKYKSKDIDIEMTYMYALKDFKDYAKLDKELETLYKQYPKDKSRLDRFKIEYQKERLYAYYKDKKYLKCYYYEKEIAKKYKDKDIYKMSGWCAYGLKKYAEAKDKFSKINLIFGESNEDIYAYALSAYKNDENLKAKEALNRIDVIKTQKEALLVSSLYIDINEQTKARDILLKLPRSSKRDEALTRINKSYTQQYYENATSIGMYYQSQTGLNGKNKFDKFSIPIDYDYYDKKKKYHLYFDGDLLYMYNGYVKTSGSSYLDFGLGTVTQDDALAGDIGFMPKLGLDYKNIKIQIGTTPLGAKITPEFTFSLSGFLTHKRWKAGLKLEQKELDETMLSFVGERAVDGSLEVNWGRMLKRGIEASISYDSSIDLSLNLAYYPQIFGLNVEKNSEKKATLVASYTPKVEDMSFVDIGALVAFDNYEKNSNLFTYGHGGYFSPQQFFLGSLYSKFGDIVGNNFYYQARVSLGFEGFIVNDTQKFPLNDGIINLGEIQKGYRDGGVTYTGALQVGYKINDNLDLISGFSMEVINGYNTKQVSFALVYRFEPNNFRSFNTFGLNHRVNQIIK